MGQQENISSVRSHNRNLHGPHVIGILSLIGLSLTLKLNSLKNWRRDLTIETAHA